MVPAGDGEGLSSLHVIMCDGNWLVQGLSLAHPSDPKFHWSLLPQPPNTVLECQEVLQV